MKNNWLTEFGFSKNPYDTKALSSEEGNQLLACRDNEANCLMQQLITSTRVPILIGDNGVGKTSIANVVAYRMSKEYAIGNQRYFVLDLKQIQSSQLLDLKEFQKDIFIEVIYLLLKEESFLRERGVEKREIFDIRNYLNRMIHAEIGIGVGPATLTHALNPNLAAEPNLIKIAQEWLKKCFCAPYSGGIICVIDNLENYGTSRQVQNILEQLRDTLFDMSGLLWVLCGTPVVVDGALASKRLEGYLAPQQIHPIKESLAPELVERRINYFGNTNSDPPVNQSLFEYLYAVVNSQLRVALLLCEEFALHLYKYPHRRSSKRADEFKTWLNQMAAELPDKQYEVPKESWQLFDSITDLGSDILSTNYNLFELANESQLNQLAAPLIYKKLLELVRTDDGYILRVTKNGWLVNYQRNGYSIRRNGDEA